MRRECGYYSNTDNSIKSCPRQSYWFSCGAAAGLVVSSSPPMTECFLSISLEQLILLAIFGPSTWAPNPSGNKETTTSIHPKQGLVSKVGSRVIALVKHQQSHCGGLSSSLSCFNHNNSASYPPFLYYTDEPSYGSQTGGSIKLYTLFHSDTSQLLANGRYALAMAVNHLLKRSMKNWWYFNICLIFKLLPSLTDDNNPILNPALPPCNTLLTVLLSLKVSLAISSMGLALCSPPQYSSSSDPRCSHHMVWGEMWWG